MENQIFNVVKTKISHLLALLAIVMMAVLIENAFLQSMSINKRAYDLIVKTIVNELPPRNLVKADGQVALADVAIPLFPSAKRLTFSDDGSVRYRINAPLNTVVKFYNQVMLAVGWQRIKSSNQAITTKGNFDKVIIALAENPITKKTEAVFYYQTLGGNVVLGVKEAQASDTVDPAATATEQLSQPQPLMPLSDKQINQTAPANNETQLEEQPRQPDQDQSNNFNNAPQPTCRVNGVEMPGACSQYNNGSDIKSMEFGRPTGEHGRQSGPSEEDMKKMDERRLKDMKRGLGQFTRSAQMMKKNVARTKAAINKCGVSIPEELNNALNSIDDLAKKIETTQTADELDEVVGSIEDVGSVMQDWGPRMGDLHRLCQMLKQADRDLKLLDRSLARYKAKKSAKIDISEILAEYKTNIDNMRQALSQAKELAKTDADEALSKIENDFYGSMDNVRNSEQAINMALNISKGLRDASAEIKRIDRDIKNLKKKKIDTAQLEELAADFKARLKDIKNLVKGKFDVDELVDKVETVFDIREQISDAMQEYGLGTMEPLIKENKSLNMQVNLPTAFQKQSSNQEDNSGQGDNFDGSEINKPSPQNMMPKF